MPLSFAPEYNGVGMSSAEQILFGADPTPGIVAVEVGPEKALVYRRDGDRVASEERAFRRWLLTTQQHPLPDAVWTRLEGDGFCWLAEFPDQNSYHNARYWLRDAHANHIAYPSAVRQYLTRSGQTLFKGLAFDDVVRLQLDIETLGLSPEPADNRIILVAICDNRGFETVIAGEEPDIIRKTVAVIRERDPDVIEGHNIHGFDLPYIECRARKHGIRLALGRDGSDMVFGAQANCMIAYYARPYVPVHIQGRHVIDTLLSVQRFDIARGALSSHGLKAAAQAYGVAEEDRIVIPHDRIASEWRSSPERVEKYALQDVRETRSLSALVCPAEFYLTQMVPEGYSRCATSGTGEKINYLFIREYLRQGRAIPKQSEPKALPGGYTDVFRTGLVERVVKCDVESLYPSIMLTNRIKPASDTLDIFLPMLDELTRRRFDAKRKVKQTEGPEQAYWDGLQGSFKILINSFFGYLGGPFNFNDYEAAARVTITGQHVVKRIIQELERTGSTVVEVDTDGVYFSPPADIQTEEAEIEYVERIGSTLPQGIRLAHDGRYRAMLSLKMKNYALLDYDGKKVFRGSSLRSRADERFGLDFIAEAADHLMHGRKDRVGELYRSTARRIESGDLALDEFARRERITEKTFVSASKKRVARAVGSAKIGEYVKVYQRSDGSIALADDYAQDEDRNYLLDKLYKFACRLREAFGDEFDLIFPRPSARSRSEAAGQQTLGLFDGS